MGIPPKKRQGPGFRRDDENPPLGGFSNFFPNDSELNANKIRRPIQETFEPDTEHPQMQARA